MTWPFEELRRRAYRVVLADPPWSWRSWSPKGLGKSPQRHYECMDLHAIKALPVRELAHPDGCCLVMWATAPMLPQAFEALAAWGFAYTTAAAWGKLSKRSAGLGDPSAKMAFGPGYRLRSAAEFILWGAVGEPRQLVRDVRNLILAPVREHSRKPDRLHADLERMFDGPRCELFARASRENWDTWGNQATRFDQKEDTHGRNDDSRPAAE
ncbi:DNA methyltransferase (plasmid) [Rhodovastum atsumiense]|uniref:DNA methyltransferase n=2 Tax=Rhodovastum atsumiense TaxID=504468 RepID=A0A5M6ITR8_9PROT|nr:MT-A70 family methyltransferase [Rhodovastum atsumiense]KAA5611662.1 DNA methyltransferase [Rhodovastum atsumiense]CAH2606225.1 DNA methyltransferase [Rhodovastum atsumiense]